MRSLVARILIVSITSTFIPRAEGAMIGTESIVGGDRERILILLERPDVAAQLESYGVNPSDAKARVAVLSDAELAVLSSEIDKAWAGAGGGGGFVVAVAMVIVFVLLLPFFLAGALIYNIVTHKGSPATQPW